MTKGKIRWSLPFLLTLSLACIIPGCRSSFNVSPDGSDFIDYRFGGGEAGADFSEITIRGDGSVTYRYHYPLREKEVLERKSVLIPGDTKKLMQDLVDAGLFELKGERLGGADLDWATIAAEIDGHEVYVQFIGSFEGAREVRRLLFPIVKKIHPEQWER